MEEKGSNGEKGNCRVECLLFFRLACWVQGANLADLLRLAGCKCVRVSVADTVMTQVCQFAAEKERWETPEKAPDGDVVQKRHRGYRGFDSWGPSSWALPSPAKGSTWPFISASLRQRGPSSDTPVLSDRTTAKVGITVLHSWSFQKQELCPPAPTKNKE